MPQQKRFTVLDSWRGVCAVLVALMHLDAVWHGAELPLLRNSFLFVDFFFVLSGFVITHAYGWRLADGAGFRHFVVERVARLWPLHATILALFVAVELAALVAQHWLGGFARAPFTGSRAPVTILTNLLLLHGLGLHDNVTWNFPSWSISVEFYTYLAFGLVVLTAGRRAGLVAAILALAGAAVVAGSHGGIDVRTDYGLFRCFYGFFLGHLVYRLHARLKDRGLGPLWAGAEPACLLAVVLFVSLAGNGPASLAAPLLFGGVVLVFSAEAGTISRLMRRRPLLRLGELSYSIYMVHAFLLLLLDNGATVLGRLAHVKLTIASTDYGRNGVALWFGSPWLMDGLALLYLAAVLATAALTYRLVEGPGRRALRELAARWRERRARLA